MAKRPKPIKKKKPKNWKLKADAQWSLCIRLRHKQCELCGRPGFITKKGLQVGGLNAHHVIGRGNLLWRHDLRNGLCLCTHCHKWNPACSPHYGGIDAALAYRDWFMDNKPKARKNTALPAVIRMWR